MSFWGIIGICTGIIVVVFLIFSWFVMKHPRGGVRGGITGWGGWGR